MKSVINGSKYQIIHLIIINNYIFLLSISYFFTSMYCTYVLLSLQRLNKFFDHEVNENKLNKPW